MVNSKMAENLIKTPAPVNNAGASDKEIYVETIVKQLYTTIIEQDFIGESLNNLDAAAKELGGEEVLYVVSVYLYRVTIERERARQKIKYMYNILKNKKYTTSKGKAKLAIHTANLLRSLSAIDAIYNTMCEINGIYYNKQVDCKNITNKLAALVFFTEDLLLSL
ncbi:hypothetical protein [Sulfolobus tengchongensis spindle-shaped virus 3]|nr:hypothetical protein [Sulfolobus tengchongensis spindle-shaped virus 3]